MSDRITHVTRASCTNCEVRKEGRWARKWASTHARLRGHTTLVECASTYAGRPQPSKDIPGQQHLFSETDSLESGGAPPYDPVGSGGKR